jgi:hypothetical protein
VRHQPVSRRPAGWGLHFFLGFIIGTVLNFLIFGVFAWLNGTPVPSWRDPALILSYPTGSALDTFLIAAVVYFLCLVFTCVIFPPKDSPAR